MKYFGTDGIRGVANESITVDLVTKVGYALTCLDSQDVVIASDPRISKDMLICALASGAMARGLKVHYVGTIPTPALVYYSYVKGYTGVMITASHNSYKDNGIKLFDKGFKLSDELEKKIEELIDNPLSYNGKIGFFVYEENAKLDYINFILKKISPNDLKIAIDCANGATFSTAPAIFGKITNKLIIIGANPNGYNINNGFGSTNLASLQQTVLEHRCDLGFAFDGDGDRVIAIDSFGNIIDGDLLVYLFARYLKSLNKLKNNQVVLSVMSNLGLIKEFKKNGIEVIETPVGDKYIFRELIQNDLTIGGENSGHIILPEILPTGDGVLVAILLCKLISTTGLKLSDWLKDVEMYADKMVNVKVKSKEAILGNPLLIAKIEEVKIKLNYECKIIVRASGTEDVVRVSVMAKSIDLVEQYLNELVELIRTLA